MCISLVACTIMTVYWAGIEYWFILDKWRSRNPLFLGLRAGGLKPILAYILRVFFRPGSRILFLNPTFERTKIMLQTPYFLLLSVILLAIATSISGLSWGDTRFLVTFGDSYTTDGESRVLLVCFNWARACRTLLAAILDPCFFFSTAGDGIVMNKITDC